MSQIAGRNVIREYEEEKVFEHFINQRPEKWVVKYRINVLEGNTIVATKIFGSEKLLPDEGLK